jgi:hypothetical protein
MLERMPKDEAGAVAAESIVRALGITSGDSFDALMTALTLDDSHTSGGMARSSTRARLHGAVGGGSTAAAAAAALASSDEGSATGVGADGRRHGTIFVHPDEVVTRLRVFVESELLLGGLSSSSIIGGTSAKAVPSPGARAKAATAMRGGPRGRRNAELEQEFWSRMTNVVSSENVRVWGALEKQLQSYLGILQVIWGAS